jgi:hypothetical protein
MTINVIGFSDNSFASWIGNDLRTPSTLKLEDESLGNYRLDLFNLRSNRKKVLFFVPGYAESLPYLTFSSENQFPESTMSKKNKDALLENYEGRYSKYRPDIFLSLLKVRVNTGDRWDCAKYLINTDHGLLYERYQQDLIDDPDIKRISDVNSFLKLKFQELFSIRSTWSTPELFWVVIDDGGRKCWMAAPCSYQPYNSESLLQAIEISSNEPPNITWF